MSQINYSFEFFPPTSEKMQENLKNTVNNLLYFNPTLYSITFGADGSNQSKTLKAVELLQQQKNNIEVMPHLTCIGSSEESVMTLLQFYKSHNIDHILALRGDIPQGAVNTGDFSHATDLISFIREKTNDTFKIYVAAYPDFHPESPNPQSDINALLHKFELGACAAITQFFFNADAFFYLRDAITKKGFKQTLIPGIMPITNYVQLARFSDMCGAEIPRWMRKILERFGDDSESLKDFGHEVILKLCERLIENEVEHLHFYTLNQSLPSANLIRDLNLKIKN